MFRKLLNSIWGRKSDIGEPIPSTVPSFRDELYSIAHGRGRPEYPCVSEIYALNSRRPAVDYSSWLVQHLLAGRTEAAEVLLWELVRGAMDNEPYQEKRWKKVARNVVSAPLESWLHFELPRAYAELRAALLLSCTAGNMGMETLGNREHYFVTEMMAAHPIAVKDMSGLVERANKFIRNMRREEKEYGSEHWKEYPLFKIDSLTSIASPTDPDAVAYQELLLSLPFSAREMLSTSVSYYSRRSGKPLEEMCPTTGDGEEHAAKLLAQRIYTEYDDIAVRVDRQTKAEYVALLEKHGILAKKSWSKAALVVLAQERIPAALEEMLGRGTLLKVDPRIERGHTIVTSYAQQCEPIYDLIYGIGIIPSSVEVP